MTLLAVPELLPEDAHVWTVVTFWAETKHFQLGSRLFASSLYADRRDAALMLRRQEFRQQCANIRAPDMRPALWWYFYGEGLM